MENECKICSNCKENERDQQMENIGDEKWIHTTSKIFIRDKKCHENNLENSNNSTVASNIELSNILSICNDNNSFELSCPHNDIGLSAFKYLPQYLKDIFCNDVFSGNSLVAWLTAGFENIPQANEFVQSFCNHLLLNEILIDQNVKDLQSHHFQENKVYSWKRSCFTKIALDSPFVSLKPNNSRSVHDNDPEVVFQPRSRKTHKLVSPVKAVHVSSSESIKLSNSNSSKELSNANCMHQLPASTNKSKEVSDDTSNVIEENMSSNFELPRTISLNDVVCSISSCSLSQPKSTNFMNSDLKMDYCFSSPVTLSRNISSTFSDVSENTTLPSTVNHSKLTSNDASPLLNSLSEVIPISKPLTLVSHNYVIKSSTSSSVSDYPFLLSSKPTTSSLPVSTTSLCSAETLPHPPPPVPTTISFGSVPPPPPAPPAPASISLGSVPSPPPVPTTISSGSVPPPPPAPPSALISPDSAPAPPAPASMSSGSVPPPPPAPPAPALMSSCSVPPPPPAPPAPASISSGSVPPPPPAPPAPALMSSCSVPPPPPAPPAPASISSGSVPPPPPAPLAPASISLESVPQPPPLVSSSSELAPLPPNCLFLPPLTASQKIGHVTSQSISKSSKPMKPLYWTKINMRAERSSTPVDTVWKHVEQKCVDELELEELFCKQAVKKKGLLMSGKKRQSRKVQTVKLLETKRSQAVAIFMSSLHIGIEDVKYAILNVDIEVVDIETMEAIYELRPQTHEMEKIMAHVKQQSLIPVEKRQPLDKPEEFLHRLWEVPYFSERIFCITFTDHFNCDLEEVLKTIEIINRTCSTLKSDNVLKLLGIILSVGNFLNKGNRTRGSADGFKLDILSKLKDVKSSGSTNLLSYIARKYILSFHTDFDVFKVICPVPCALDVLRSSHVKYDELKKDLDKIEKKLNDCEQKALKIINCTQGETHNSFQNFIKSFLAKAHSAVDKTKKELSDSQLSFESTVAYFGVKQKEKKSNLAKEFFSYWASFCSDLHEMWSTQLKYILDTNKKKADAKVTEKRSTLTANIVKAPLKPNSLKARLENKSFNSLS